jgi:hypothetical protein
MGSREAEIFKKSISAYQKEWRDEVKKPLKQIEDISKELDPLNEKSPLNDDEKKRQTELTKQREKLQETIDNAAQDLKRNLTLLDPPANTPKDEMNDLLKWLKKTFEKIADGLPLSDRIKIKPDVDFNWKKLKFESVGFTLEWKF